MKKGYVLTAVILSIIIALPAAAQQMRFGVEAGGTINKSTWEPANGQKTKGVGGYSIGIVAEYEIYDNTWFQSGLIFTTKGAQSETGYQPVKGHSNYNVNVTKTFRPMYIQIPLTVAYKFSLTEKLRIFGAGGGYIAQGLTGEYNKKTVYDRPNTPESWKDTSESESSFSSGALKRFDAGLTLGAGIEFGKLVLRVNYDWGMLNVAKEKDVIDTDNFKNRSLAITAGFRF